MANRPKSNWLLKLIALLVAASVRANEPAPAPVKPWPCGCEVERRLHLGKPWLRGSDVFGLQIYLSKLGYDPGPADGVYGPQTAVAVKEFQRRSRLKPDGVVHEATWFALGQTAAKHARSRPARPANVVLVIDVRLALLAVVDQGRVIATFPVALGKEGTPTPVGVFRITRKAEWGGGFGTRWLGLNVPWGIYGIHGTNKAWTVGGYESHGCIRMLNADVEALSDMVAVGTAVHIIGDPFYGTVKLGPGDSGAPVVFLQKRLRQLGIYHGQADGEYGLVTERAVMAIQKAHGLPVTGRVEWEEFSVLRLRMGD